jgi:hypothetical protein
LEDQLNMYRQQWQADHQKQSIEKMAGKMPGKSNDGKRKNNERNHHNTNGGRSGGRQGNNCRGGRGGCGGGRGGRGGRGSNTSAHLKTIECLNCGKKVLLRTAPHQEIMTLRIQTWYPKRISKIFSIFIERHVYQVVKTDKEEREHENR